MTPGRVVDACLFSSQVFALRSQRYEVELKNKITFSNACLRVENLYGDTDEVMDEVTTPPLR